MKKSNILLLGFYLTLLSCLVTFLVCAKSYIDENSSKDGYSNEMDGPELRVIDKEIHHLVMGVGLYVQGVVIGKETKISYYDYNDQTFESACRISGDTMFLNDNISILTLQLANKLKSIRFEHCQASLSTDILEPNASVFISGGMNDDNKLYCDGTNIGNLHLELVNVHLIVDSNEEGTNMTIDTLKVGLYNAEIEIKNEADEFIGALELFSNYYGDHISASPAILQKMKLYRNAPREIKY